MNQFRFFILIILVGISFSCVKETPIPGYVTVNEFTLDTKFEEGSDSHHITDVWVYLDDEFQGTYEVPATFPVLADGSHLLRLRAGIKVSGLDAWRSIYQFYDFESHTVDFKPNEDYVFNPTVEYFSETKFAWMEDFENPGLSFKATENSDTSFQRINDNQLVFEGNGSGGFFLDTNRRIFEGITNSTYNLPIAGRSVYLEMDYRSSNTMVIGVIGWQSGGLQEQKQSLILYPSEEWNKIYVNLSVEVSSMSDALGYSIWIGAILDAENDTSYCYYDNFKLIHE